MGQGGSFTQRIDIISSIDPRSAGRAAQKGTLYRFIPASGDPVLLIKADEGFSTNWINASGSGGDVTPAARFITGSDSILTTDSTLILNDNSSSNNDLTLPEGTHGLTFKFGFAADDNSNWQFVASGDDVLDPRLDFPFAAATTFPLTFLDGAWYLA